MDTPETIPSIPTAPTPGERAARWFTTEALPPLRRAAVPLAVLAVLGVGLTWLSHQRVEVPRGEQLVRRNTWTDGVDVLPEGTAWVLPGIHTARQLPARDLLLRATRLASYRSPQALQTVEGLSVGLEVNLRVALDARQLPALARKLPDQIGPDFVEPALAGILYAEVSQHTVRELFSTQRAEIQRRVQAALTTKLAAEGLILKDLQFGAIDLPPDYRKGLDSLLSEGLASDKMRFTLELREKQVRESALAAQAERERREIQAEAAAREQVIAARAQEEAMKHVLPFKQRQIEQRQLEAEAERQSRIKLAEGAAQARQIEAAGEAKARQKLADAEAYRVAELGKVNGVQMEREGRLISKHPLLVQKALIDKLGDKIQVIVAPPGTSGQLLSSIAGRTPEPVQAEGAEPQEGTQ
ncbi:SPFH domain-containing protein [Roseateles paludis]|jgi:regulator of protease activity HflC (stomatin/prohibitin superfamily)|uniref:SPFH domain-containing protein n=1 Tax=Roseateles paludis TaxID=3145238 RepID=A0ABV0FZ33_9BURK